MRRRIEWSAVRAAYESGREIGALCSDFGLSRQTLMRRKRKDCWQAPRGGQPLPPGGSLPGAAGKAARRVDYLTRLFSLLEKTMSIFEERLASRSAEAAAFRDGDAKLLNSMAALYEKLKGLEAEERKKRGCRRKAGNTADESGLRKTLAERLDGLRRGTGTGSDLPGDRPA